MSRERFLRLLDAAEYLAAHIHEAPVWIVPCLEGEAAATRWSGSSIYPAVQNMLLAARALGLGATLTTLHLVFEKVPNPLRQRAISWTRSNSFDRIRTLKAILAKICAEPVRRRWPPPGHYEPPRAVVARRRRTGHHRLSLGKHITVINGPTSTHSIHSGVLPITERPLVGSEVEVGRSAIERPGTAISFAGVRERRSAG